MVAARNPILCKTLKEWATLNVASLEREPHLRLLCAAGQLTSGFLASTPKQASPMSRRRFLAPLIAETRRRIAVDMPTMAEPGSIE